jgi:hypothetical protein
VRALQLPLHVPGPPHTPGTLAGRLRSLQAAANPGIVAVSARTKPTSAADYDTTRLMLDIRCCCLVQPLRLARVHRNTSAFDTNRLCLTGYMDVAYMDVA